jgi:hypothetical protein
MLKLPSYFSSIFKKAIGNTPGLKRVQLQSPVQKRATPLYQLNVAVIQRPNPSAQGVRHPFKRTPTAGVTAEA